MERTLRGQVKGDTAEVATEPQRFGNVNWHLLADSVHFAEQNATYFHFLSMDKCMSDPFPVSDMFLNLNI